MTEVLASPEAGLLSDRRTFPRYPAWLDVQVQLLGGATTAPGTIVDISEGGALVLTQQGFSVGDGVGLTLTLSNHPFTLEGAVLLTEPSWMGEMLHIRFRPWRPRERLIILRLVDDLHAGFEEHQRAIWSHNVKARRYGAHPADPVPSASEPTSQRPGRTPSRRRTRP